MSGEYTNKKVGRLIAAGSRSVIDDVVSVISRLKAVHINDYADDQEGFTLGTPSSRNDTLGSQVSTYRAIVTQTGANGPTETVPLDEARSIVDNDFTSSVQQIMESFTRVGEIEDEINANESSVEILSVLEPLGIDLHLLGGYTSIVSFVGTCSSTSAITDMKLPDDAYAEVVDDLVAVFCSKQHGAMMSSILESSGFQAIEIPEGRGSISLMIDAANLARSKLDEERQEIQSRISEWTEENGAQLCVGLELLELDFSESEAPVKIAVTDHTFVIDGWITDDRSEEVIDALAPYCTYTEYEAVRPTVFHHDHEGEHTNEPKPPVAFGDHQTSAPMELLTDAIGRSEYGRMDPTVFMLFSYPLFFGLMLGDMAYGLLTISLGLLIRKSFPSDKTDQLTRYFGMLLIYIGLATVFFGYMYGEFAGFEFLPHIESQYTTAAACKYTWTHDACFKDAYDVPSWVSWMTALYPNGGKIHYVLDLPYSLTFAFPFHRVSSDLMNLIVISIYIGIFHLMVGFVLGAIDEVRVGHGWQGALYGKVSWMIIMVGGFLFCYDFYKEDSINMPGIALISLGLVFLVIHLMQEGLPLAISMILAPIEAIGLLSSTLSYIRLFAVGIVGVKIAYAGNDMLYSAAMDGFSDGGLGILIGVAALLGWFGVQLFAWVLGLVSPNIHAVRLHFVEWMKQFYLAEGEPFEAFGFKERYIEVDNTP
ncbi:MAG: V-type ATP synthase subunit I [Candidatus Thalassarchaeaceae archaeon]|tara:strand:+ start:3727 stop:5847 length:2121 start_codon:yes stop_codon:yes gene_type:complete